MKCNNWGDTHLNLCHIKHVEEMKHIEVYTRFDGDSDGFWVYVGLPKMWKFTS